MRRILLPLLTVSLLAVSLAGPGRADVTPDIRSVPFAFGAPQLITTGNYGEPQLVLDHQDHVLICTPGGGVNIFRSTNWTTFTKKLVTNTNGGGDCDIAVGPDNAVYIADLQLFGSAIRKSTDDGQTWGSAVEDPVEQDRQFLVADPKDPNTVYFGYHDFVAEAQVLAKSTDGGQHFVVHTVASTDPTLAPDTYPNTNEGNFVVDPTNTQRIFMVYAISSAQSNAGRCPPPASNPLICPFGLPHSVIVAASADGGVTWADHRVIGGDEADIVANPQPRIAIDKAGNLYAVTAGHIKGADGQEHNGMFYSYSTDHGATWSAPINVSNDTGATVFPTVAAGNDGRVDFAWTESSSADNTDPAGQWTMRFAQGLDAHSANPTITEVTGPVIHTGDVCVLGIGCGAGEDRSLLDFMGLGIDSFGYAHIASGDNNGKTGVMYWRQDAGPSVYSDPCPVNPGPDCVYTRPGPQP